MVEYSSGLFQVVLLCPRAKVFEGRCGMVILPGHDGWFGVMRNHLPMLYKLSMGIMQVKRIPDGRDAFFLIEGGFARINENFVTILAYDVTTFEGMQPHQAGQILSKARESLAGKAYIHSQMEAMEAKRASLIVKMGQWSGISE